MSGEDKKCTASEMTTTSIEAASTSTSSEQPKKTGVELRIRADNQEGLELRIWTYPSVLPLREDDNGSVLAVVNPDGSEFVLPRSSDLRIPEELTVFHEQIEHVFRNSRVSNLILEDMHFYTAAFEYLLKFPLPSCVLWHEMWTPREHYEVAEVTLAFFEAWQPKHLCFQIEDGDALPVPIEQLTKMSYISDLRTFYIGSDNEAGRWHDFDGAEHINDEFLQRAASLRRLEVYAKRTGITVDGLKSLLTSWWTGGRVFESIVFEFDTEFQNVYNMLKSVLDEHTTYTSEDCHALPGIQAGMSYKFSIVPTKADIKCVDAYMFGKDGYTRIRLIDREVEPETEIWFQCTEPSEWCLLCWHREPHAYTGYVSAPPAE